ncbi:META domain-containing protein [Chachezhania sediminis]|uniref:META domain-containing protein n=1 Tax=Chachezhania sediminis TaxID=2599291 RepID=UPI00131A92B5|nr:META domain-containing protein [Chachezhania sediminis]
MYKFFPALGLACILTAGAAFADDLTGKTWVLQALNGEAFPPSEATLIFGDDGRISGAAPCNQYSAKLQSQPPAFQVGPIASTRMACPEMQEETAFFNALGVVTSMTLDGNNMVLNGPDDFSMVFGARPGVD